MNICTKKVILVIVFGYLVLLMNPVDLSAGDYHNNSDRGAPSDTLACSQCHTMHYSQGNESLVYGDSSSIDRFPKLLRAENIVSLCLYCHGASGLTTEADDTGRIPPRIEDTRSLGADAYTPSAGDFADRNVVNEENRHSIRYDVSSFEPPGYSGTSWDKVTYRFSNTFNCLFCHAQHGNKNYRNLRYDPGNPTEDDKGAVAANANIRYVTDDSSATTTATNCSDGVAAPCDVYIRNNTDDTDNRWKYVRSNVTFGVANGAEINGISVFCGKCHGDFYGLSADTNMGGIDGAGVVGDGDESTTSEDSGGGPWLRHPVGDISFSKSADNTLAGNGHIDIDNLNIKAGLGTFTFTRYADGGIGTNWPGGYKDDATDAFNTIDGEQPFCLSCHYAHGGGNANYPGVSPAGRSDKTIDHSMLVFTDNDGDVNIEPTGTLVNQYNASPNPDLSQHYMRNTCNQCHNQ